jgi:hypothetical protein
MFKVFEPLLDKAIPPAYKEMGRKSNISPAMLRPQLTFAVIAYLGHRPRDNNIYGGAVPIGLDGVSVQPIDMDRGSIVKPLPDNDWYSAIDVRRMEAQYRFFSTHVYFDGYLPGKSGSMPLLPITPVPFEIVRGKIAYRVSEIGLARVPEQELSENGYLFRVDEVKNLVYYTNSVACYYGLPPVAEALDWPKLDLAALPSDWIDKEVRGGVMPLGSV